MANIETKKCECIEGDDHLCEHCMGDAIDGAEYALSDR